MSFEWNRNLTIGLAAAGVVALLVYGFWPDATPVTSADVIRAPMHVTVEEEGQTRLSDAYVVSAPASGYLQRVGWRVGDAVTAGQVLARLSTLPAQVLDARSLEQARAQVDAAQAGVEQAREEVRATEAAWSFADSQHERMVRLASEGTATTQQRDAAASDARQAQARHQAAQLAVERAQQDLRAARAQVSRIVDDPDAASTQATVRAPVDGRVLHVHHESAGVVQAGMPLVEVGDPTALEVVVDVLSSDAVRIAPNTRVVLADWGGSPLDGRVRRVEPVGRTTVSALGVEEQRVDVVIDVTSPPETWSRLGTGYRVLARFVLWESDDALQIPQSALFRDGDRWAVFAIHDGRAHLTPVSVGHRSGLTAQVTDGLAPGDRVVTHPGPDVADGVRVDGSE